MVFAEVGTGFLGGILHVVTGPDHLAALAPIATKGQGTIAGAVWGAGHGTGVVILGLIATVLKEHIDIDFLSRWSEYFVGFILIAIGVWALRSAGKLRRWEDLEYGSLETSGGGLEMVRVGLGDACDPESAGLVGGRVDALTTPKGHASSLMRDRKASLWGAYGVGILHGAAGTGHLFGVLPSLALPPAGAAIYLFSYLASAVLSMAARGEGLKVAISLGFRPFPPMIRISSPQAFGYAIGTLARHGSRVGVRLYHVTYGAAFLAIGVGLFWIFSQNPTSE